MARSTFSWPFAAGRAFVHATRAPGAIVGACAAILASVAGAPGCIVSGRLMFRPRWPLILPLLGLAVFWTVVLLAVLGGFVA